MRLAICDDDNEIACTLINKLKLQYGDLFEVNTFNTGFAFVTYVMDVVKGNVDLVIMDINIGVDNGVQLVKNIHEKYPHIKVIYLTSYIKYAEDVFETSPVYFLVKPIKDEKLFAAIDRAVLQLKKEKELFISIVFNGTLKRIQTTKIKYIESDKREIVIFENNKQHKTLMKLDKLENAIPDHFLRCHQSYIVNMDHIEEFTENFIKLNTGEIIPVSRNRHKQAKKIFKEYIGKKL